MPVSSRFREKALLDGSKVVPPKIMEVLIKFFLFIIFVFYK
jgi:hypothetical protein